MIITFWQTDWPIFEVSVELWNPKACFREDSQKPNSFDKGAEVDQEEHEDGGEDSHKHDELNIAGGEWGF